MVEKANFDIDPMMGKKIKDSVTEFEGIVTGIIQHLTGCKQFAVSPPIKKDGDARDVRIIDEGRAIILGQGIRPETVIKKQDGPGACDIPSEIGTPL